MHKKPEKILIVRTDRFGEFLLIIPALRALKETFPGAAITAVVHPSVAPIAGCIPFIDTIMTWDPHTAGPGSRLRMIMELRAHAYSRAVIFNPAKEFHLMTFCAGIPVRAGYARKWGWLLNRRMEDTKYRAEKHEIEYNLDLVSLIGAATTDKSLSLRRNNGIIGQALPPAPVIAVHPFTSDPVKQWPFESFKQLISLIPRELKAAVVILGGPQEEYSYDRFLRDVAGAHAVDLVGKTSLPELARVLEQCAVLISGDSGPVHLASCTGTPVVALFRSDLPGKSAVRWGPLSEGSRVLQSAHLDSITVPDVIEACRKVLGS